MPTPPITFHRCEHIKVNGIQCGSPALRAKRRCFFHEQCVFVSTKTETGLPELISISALEDANSIQLGIAEVIRMLVMKYIDPPIGALLLRALRLAAANVKFTSFEPKSAQVVVDPFAIEDRFAVGRATFDPDYETAETLPEKSPEATNETNHRKIAADDQSAEAHPPNQAQPVKSAIPQYMRGLILRFHENNEQMRAFRKATPLEIAKLSESVKPVESAKVPASTKLLQSANPPASAKLPASTEQAPQHDSNLHGSNLQEGAALDVKIPNPSTFPTSEYDRTAQESCL